MTLAELIKIIKEDLRREVTHMMFYLQSSAMVKGPHVESLAEFFMNSAKSEMEHVREFSDMLVGLGEINLNYSTFSYLISSDLTEITKIAIGLEEEVIKNYEERIRQAEEVGGVDGRWLVVFFEDQLEDSRKDLDHLRRML